VRAPIGRGCNNAPMATPTEPDTVAELDLGTIWRAAALITADVGSASWVTTEVARAHPRPERERASALAAALIDRGEAVRDAGDSPAPLPLHESTATTLARIRSALDQRSLGVWVLLDVMGVEPGVLANALRCSEQDIEAKSAEAAETIRGTLDREAGGAAGELRDAIDAFDPSPGLGGARDAIRRDTRRRRRNAAAAVVVFGLFVAMLIYVKIDLQRAQEKEEQMRENSAVSDRFSNPAPEDDGAPADEPGTPGP